MGLYMWMGLTVELRKKVADDAKREYGALYAETSRKMQMWSHSVVWFIRKVIEVIVICGA